MPETKGKTFSEINASFAKRNGVSINEYSDAQNVPLKPMNSMKSDVKV